VRVPGRRRDRPAACPLHGVHEMLVALRFLCA
jgi:hypothetical protein